jgi:hypothetical protein
MDKGNGSQHFVRYDQWGGHDGASVELEGTRITCGIEEVHENGAATADGLPRNRALRGLQAQSAETLGPDPVGFSTYHFVG